jgi:hypothetical protein
MPNWCNNHLVLGHKDAREIGRAKLAILEGNFFQEFHPCPQELLDTTAGFFGDNDKQRKLEEQTQANIRNHGYANWYDWNIANWGTKWDASDAEIVLEHYDGDIAELTVVFDTAWAPPTEFYNELVEQGFEVSAMYNEFGMGFCGQYCDGTDQYVEYTEGTVDTIPKDIDDHFGISEAFIEWADEEDEEEEDA